MSKILIVDDEKWIREGIKVKLKRMGYRAEQIAEADDGIEALKKMKENPADIVLSDIRMDGMDGLKMCETLKAEYPWTQKVIICGYSEFDYAAKAIELGAVRYLLKPISFEELSDAVGVCEENLEKLRRYRQSEEISKLETIYRYGRYYKTMLCDQETIRNIMQEYREGDSFIAFYFFIGRHIELSPWGILQILEKSVKGYIFGKNLLLINKSPSEYIALYLLKEGREVSQIGIIRECVADVFEENALWDFTCGVSERHSSALNAIYESRDVMRHKIIWPEQHFIDKAFIRQNSIDYHVSDEDKLGLVYAIKQKDYTAYSGILQKIQKEVQNTGISYDSVECLYRQIWSMLDEINLEITENRNKDFLFEDVWQYHSLKDIFKVLKEWGLSRINISGSDGPGQKEQMVKWVKEYIERYYYKEISLEQLAKNHFVSSSYLSVAFRDLIGMNFQEYLNDVRLAMAKKLLLEKKYKVGMVASMVGFSDQHYFSRVFKKNEGCTPKEYMEKIKNQE
ncbi:MAG: response regulator transcription factor [Marvinbryantia sp.]|jgi:two-component system response regulator YesN